MTKEENIKFREKLIKQRFKNSLGYDLNLDNPQTFNEKIQWLKLYNHDPLITKCADKYLAREYIKEKVGEEYLIPLLGVWDKAEDIDFDSLPNQFVLKVNWGWGQNIIVKDKTKLDIEEVKNKLNSWLDPLSNHYYYNFEWSYKNILPKIICEKYINELENKIFDYKFHCFNGIPYYLYIIEYNTSDKARLNMYNMKWEKVDLFFDHYKNTDHEIDKPPIFNLMIDISKKISSDFYYVRLDLMYSNNKLYIGELTFTPTNGMGTFEPIEWDYKFGELLELPKEKKIEYDVLDRDALIQQAVLLEPISEKYKELGYVLKYKDKLLLEKDAIIEEYEKIINKITWWIPIKKWRERFRAKFKIRPDQTRPDQTRPDQTRPDQT
ncbi:ATP-grasp fold amidoligase family protein [Brachyspira pilosicoli]|uniref:ATP-grasp fold amidoligase family protein n=1 Tax=Brachyspira pilosicoli TaxID=52584 RepID=UPI0012F51C72|nr:ATP-grasp fold amidoligase family protein [Brachyspira pilosicoli]